jgi:very-short-patch-repair endonuclease
MQRLPQHTKDFSRQLRTEMTDAEKYLWQRLRMKQLGVKFRRQHPAGKYILDFACIDTALAIEIDGVNIMKCKLKITYAASGLRSMVGRYCDSGVMRCCRI